MKNKKQKSHSTLNLLGLNKWIIIISILKISYQNIYKLLYEFT